MRRFCWKKKPVFPNQLLADISTLFPEFVRNLKKDPKHDTMYSYGYYVQDKNAVKFVLDECDERAFDDSVGTFMKEIRDKIEQSSNDSVNRGRGSLPFAGVNNSRSISCLRKGRMLASPFSSSSSITITGWH